MEVISFETLARSAKISLNYQYALIIMDGKVNGLFNHCRSFGSKYYQIQTGYNNKIHTYIRTHSWPYS